MNHLTFFLISTMLMGLGATLTTDLWALFLKHAFKLNAPNYCLVGLAILTAPMPAVYGISGILAWLIFTLLLATVASAFPARRASRLTVRDTLAYE